jgi:hypothetical protein
MTDDTITTRQPSLSLRPQLEIIGAGVAEMRKVFFWAGWVILGVLPIIFVTHALIIQNMPVVQPWKWAVPLIAIAMIFFSRNRDNVLHHRLPVT